MTVALMAFLMLQTVEARNITVVDDSDNSLLQGATVIGKSGLIIGITDDNGKIDVPSDSQFPISIRSIGYEPTTVTVDTDTARLIPAVYTLKDVVVREGERPIQRVVCFAREYATGATPRDTMQLYSEYMLVAFLKDESKKVKGYKSGDKNLKERGVRRYSRYVDSSGAEKVETHLDDDEITMLSWQQILSVPDYDVQLSEKSKSQAADTVMGKFWPARTMRRHNGTFTIKMDYLSEIKEHKWSPFFLKMLGMTIDVDNMQISSVYRDNEAGVYSLDDFVYSTYSIHMLARGKIFKKIFHSDSPIEMEAYLELYPVSVEYLTVEEYKEMRDDRREIPFQSIPNLQPLPAAVSKLIEK